MDGIVAYLLSKKFTKDTVVGMGAIKGAACQVQSVNKVGKITTITLKWEDNVGTSHTQSFDIEDGLDGVSVQGATIDANGHLKLTLSNGTVLDCGQVLPQYDTMPSPSASNVGQILQYIGTTTTTYTNGYFYQCINDGGVYKWVAKSVQNSYDKSETYNKTEIGDITNLPDNTKTVVENIGDLKLSIDQLQASKLSISDIDDALSNVSENPVQNKVIKLTLDQLRGSILDKLDDKEDRFRVTSLPLGSADLVDKIVQYIGNNTSSLTKGYFYQCVEVSAGVYDWVQKNVQPNSGGTGGDGVVDGYYNSVDHLFYEEAAHTNPITGDDNTLYVSLDTNLLYRYNGSIFIRVDEGGSGENDVINGYYNTTDGKFYEDSTYTTEITGETGKIYISIDTNIQYRWDDISTPHKFVTISSSIDVDNAFSLTSENPVQNKVITAKVNDLDTLMATKLSLDDVDSALSGSSLYPVQNRVIKLELDKLQGSVLDKIRKKLDANKDDFAIWDNNGEVVDSGISKDIIPNSASASNKVLVKSDVDDALSDTSENPVQNKKITVPLQALQGSVANIKLDITDLQASILNKQDKLTEGNGIDINGTNVISVNISYLTASRLGFIPNSEKGDPSGVAELNSSGKVPSSQLPSYVDDVVDGYLYDATHFYEEQVIGGYYNSVDGNFYEDSGYTILITPVLGRYYLDISTGNTYEWDGTGSYVSATPTRIFGESGKIYISLDTNIQYRWTGTAFAALGGALQLGETSSTAYRGDRGKIAYDHSQITDGSNPHQTTADNVNLKVPISMLSGTKLNTESALNGLNTDKADTDKAYLVNDAAETDINNADYFPFYDSSATGKRKTLFSNLKEKLALQWGNPYT